MGERNKEEELSVVARAAIGVVLMTILFVVLYNYQPTNRWICQGHSDDKSCLRALFSEFQTLIAGLFAVFAAWWTVDTMEKTDTKAGDRHRHLVALTLREEARQIDRLLNPYFTQIGEQLRKLESFVQAPVPQQLRSEQTVANLLSSVAVAEQAMSTLVSITRTSAWRDAENLMDGDLTRANAKLMGEADRIKRYWKNFERLEQDRLHLVQSIDLAPEPAPDDFLRRIDLISAQHRFIETERMLIQELEYLRVELGEVNISTRAILQGLIRLKGKYSGLDI